MIDNRLNYRPEIDGLRALAVLAVIFYHAELEVGGEKWFQGGYLGVDIFFVISGYLIGRIILSEVYKVGHFNFLNFYERRARRILPVLLLVMLVSFPFSWFLLYPGAFLEYVNSILSSIFFSSNYYFYLVTTSYGAESSLLKPFLHTWSLAIEEQFYIVFPVLIILIYRFARENIFLILALLFFVGLVIAEYMSTRNASLNFFLPITRSWELLAGVITAYIELKRRRPLSKKNSSFLPVLGLVLIFASLLKFDAETFHPGGWSLIPVAGVFLIILTATQSDIVGGVLGKRPLVNIGLISYSAYLWHFPLFAFSRIHNPVLNNTDKIILIFFTLMLAIVSYFTVEKPFRKNLETRTFFRVTAFMVILILLFCLFVIIGKGDFNRFTMPEAVSSIELDNDKLFKERLDFLKAWNLNHQHAYIQEGDNKPRVLVVGNSHGGDLTRMMVQQISLTERMHILNHPVQMACFASNHSDDKKKAIRLFTSEYYKKADIVIISSLYHDSNKCMTIQDKDYPTDIEGLQILIAKVKGDNKKLLVTGFSPIFSSINNQRIADYWIKEYMKSTMQMPVSLLFSKINRQYYERLSRPGEIDGAVKDLAHKTNTPFLNKTDYVCDDDEMSCYGITDTNRKSFFDQYHYTLAGAKFFGERALKIGWFDPLIELVESKESVR